MTLRNIENEKNSELKRLLGDLTMDEKIEIIKTTKHILRNGLSIRNCPN
jgi:hypothetical protein